MTMCIVGVYERDFCSHTVCEIIMTMTEKDCVMTNQWRIDHIIWHWKQLVISQNHCKHKTYLVMSNGELLIVLNIEGNGDLWSNVVFLEGSSLSHKKKLNWIGLNFKASEWKHTTCATWMFFLPFIYNYIGIYAKSYSHCTAVKGTPHK